MLALIGVCVLTGCRRNDMADQDRKDPLEPSTFYADGTSARAPVVGTVAWTPGPYVPRASGTDNGRERETFPFRISAEDLRRGRERYEINCAHCHGRTGEGNGIVVQRGFTRPPAYFPVLEHQAQFPDLYRREQALVNTTPGHVFNVITNGYGAMYSHAARVVPDDRWRIAAYVKALQLSRTIKPESLSPEDREKLQNAQANATTRPTTSTNPTEAAPR